VSALAATDIWAVGNTQTYPFQTLVLHWNGSAWSTVPSPTVGTESNFLNAVNARAANDAWAVGYTSIGSNNQAIILHWNGTQWSVVPSPATDTVLNGVAAPAANDAWAVGRDASGAVIEHWNGQAWTVYPYPAGALGELDDILALASNDLWAVGTIRGSSGWNTLALHWDGTAWTRIASANNNDINVLQGVGAVTAEDLWAVGVSAFSGPMTESGSDAARGKDGAFPQGGQGVLTEHYICALPSPTATPTRTPHAGQFEDVPPGSTFYDFVECMGTHGIISGYPCGGPGEPCYSPPKPYFRTNNNVTRGQVSKMVASAAGWTDPVPSTQQTFEDVPPGSTFWLYIERLAGRGAVGGYPCGGPFEPCVAPANRPYFRPNNNLTRGQLAKIVAEAAQYTETPTGQLFEDVPPTNTFYLWVERVGSRGIVGGYPCGGPGEPCNPPGNRPYYRPVNNVTRGQTAKIVTNTFFPNCQTPPSPTPGGPPPPTETAGVGATPSATSTLTETPGVTMTPTGPPLTATPTATVTVTP
jgi:hypothetical protein